ncbi:gamma-tubulin complex component 5-like [Pomacea canaliculata]|uniref:gamma-tubulin complex component 5-like n=1 Tax=Pomacea canaliculata TaxID=400727 RepID=UPI000D7296A7|nr:gamma-tubulin complex component 5-like [Pomacea canaliculata]
MARIKADELTRQLITHVTGFQEGDENFGLCLQFVLSNFRYHRFLDVNSHKVLRLLDGLCTKLQVHSLKDRADSLRSLVSQFLDKPLLSDNELTKTDAHYAVLLVLFTLGLSPTNAIYETPVVEAEEELTDTFNWTAHLLEGEDIFLGYHSDTSSEEDEKLESSSEDEQLATEEGDTTTDDEHKHTVCIVHAGMDICLEARTDTLQGKEWLNQNVIVQYWRGQYSDSIRGQHASSNLLRDWSSYQLRSGEAYSSLEQHVVTEYQLIRELLWMLSGVEELFLFQLGENGFHLKEGICLSHLTEASLQSFLEPLMKQATQIRTLQSFIRDMLAGSCQGFDKTGDTKVPQTYQAFAYGLSNILKEFRGHLSQLEKTVSKQEHSKCVTVSSIIGHLQPWLQTLEVIWEMFVTGVSLCAQPPDHDKNSLHASCLHASQLLNALYDGVVLHDNLSHCSAEMMSLLFRLLLETSRPYLNIIGQWIAAGQLCDPAREFVLQRNERIESLDETFWERAVTLNISGSHLHQETSNTSLSSAGLCAEQEEDDRTFKEAQDAIPKFLLPVLQDVVLTGKSMELLQALGKLPEVVAFSGDFSFREKSLFEMFVESLKDIVGTVTPSTPGSCQGDYLSTACVHGEYSHRASCHRSRGSAASNQFSSYIYIRRMLAPVSQACIGPISLVFQRCLYPHVRRRCDHVCSRLLEILKGEYHLLDMLNSAQQFYLMSAGDTMFDFCTQIFDKMRHTEQWRDTSSLTLALHDALQAHHSQDISRLSVTADTLPKAGEKSAVCATDCIKLHYDVAWPLDMVITSKCQDLYNQVFQFLLQIKRAKYGLDQLRFTDLDKADILTVTLPQKDLWGKLEESKMPIPERLHRMHILRFRLAYFVNSLHNYIMTRILRSTGLEFGEQMKSARDLEQFIHIHARYVVTIHERCLLHKKLTFLKDAVTKVLNLILIFSARWDQGIAEISGKAITDMEAEFSRCIQFLASFLNNIIKRGSFPHVEPLAFALVTSLPQAEKM